MSHLSGSAVSTACVLVTGSSGFIGGHLVTHLRSLGYRVVTHLPWQSATIAQQMRQAQVTHIVHLAGMAHDQVAGAGADDLLRVNAAATVKLFEQAAQAGVEAFVWLSSIKVLGEIAAQPLTPRLAHDPIGPYAQSKAAGERLLQLAQPRFANTRLVIVRPPLVYGPGVSANFLQLLRWSARPLPLPLAMADAQRSMVGVGNLTDLIGHTLHGPAGTFHVSDGCDWSVAQLLRYCASQQQSSLRLWPVPVALLHRMLSLLGRANLSQRLLQPLRVDITDTEQRLGWRAPFSVEQQLTETLNWFLKQA